MISARDVLGNIYNDNDYMNKYNHYIESGRLEKAVIPSKDRMKNKMRLSTNKGTDVGITISGQAKLLSGDVIFFDEQRMIVIEIQKDYALVIDFDENINSHELLKRAIKFGHLIGNQHWKLMTKENSVYLPIAIDKKVMETIINGGNIPGITIRYEEIDQSDFEESDYEECAHHHS